MIEQGIGSRQPRSKGLDLKYSTLPPHQKEKENPSPHQTFSPEMPHAAATNFMCHVNLNVNLFRGFPDRPMVKIL